MKSCGGCQYFIKWHLGGGFCDRLDARTSEDARIKCKYRKGIKYKRKNKKEKK